MRSIDGVGLSNVQAVYGGPEGDLWELVMGQQIHVGGLRSSLDLAEKAGIGPGMTGVDLCCCSGAGMRVLVRFRNVDRMVGVDATETVIRRGRRRTEEEGLADRISFKLADACDSGLPSGEADFAWGEDAWCYVVNKPQLIAEAVRIVKPGGTIAFTDWVEGRRALSDAESKRLLGFMKFPNIQDLDGYAGLLSREGCDMILAEDTGRFIPCVDLYLNMLHTQLTYDALRIINFDNALMAGLAEEMNFLRDLVHSEKLIQGLVVARKRK